MSEAVYYVLLALSILITLSVHEFSHAYAAHKLGDNTALLMGRLTLNPLKHIDPIGAICMLFFRFGWAKPVPINPRNFRKPKRDFAISSLAGPLSNLILALFCAFVYLLILALTKDSLMAYNLGIKETDFTYHLIVNTLDLFALLHYINVGFAVFNLIPIPPLDGSRILNVILPSRLYFKIMRYERYIYWGFIGWLLLGSFLANALRSIPLVSASPILNAIAGVFSLSDIIAFLSNGLSDGIFALLKLIPFLN